MSSALLAEQEEKLSADSILVEKKLELFNKDQAYNLCLKAVKNELAAKVLVDKYLLSDLNRCYVETTPYDMWSRLSRAIVLAEKPERRKELFSEFNNLLYDFKFVPAGRILYGLGNPYVRTTLKSCYVIAIEDDSIEGIFTTSHHMAETYKYGGGCGTDISPLRPRGSPVKNAARESTGAVSFMGFFSHVTGMIGQKARIGALMITIDVSHPDIEEFISIKGSDNLDLIRYANISVKITDEFMQAVKNNHDFDLRWGGRIYKTVKARELWNKITHNAWKRAEPGILFWDHVCDELPAHGYKGFECVSCNPCSEVSLSHGDSCNLGSMNLGKYVRSAYLHPYFDFDEFDGDTRLAVRFLDNIISLEKAPLEFQQWANDNGRRLGLGMMGVADAFLKMNIRYDSPEAIELADKIAERFMIASYDASCDLAIEKGSFPVFCADTHLSNAFIKRLPDFILNKIAKTGIRNIAVNAIAPTGSLGCIAQCSTSIEPVFMMEHIRRTNLGTAKKVEEHHVVHSIAQEYMELMNTDKLPDHFVSAHQINPETRIKLQGTIQKYIDQSISSTTNLPKETTEEQIGDYYMEAWRQGCKGLTVYRDGVREGVLVSTNKVNSDEIQISNAPKRPDVLDAEVHVIKPNGKSYAVFVGLLNGRVYEVFAIDHKQAAVSDGMKGKIFKERRDKESIYNFESGAMLIRQLNRYEETDASLITRIMSTALRHGTPLEVIVDQISKSQIPMASFARACARALSRYIRQEEVKGKLSCPECESKEIKLEGTCYTCLDCGYSRCS